MCHRGMLFAVVVVGGAFFFRCTVPLQRSDSLAIPADSGIVLTQGGEGYHRNMKNNGDPQEMWPLFLCSFHVCSKL